MTLIGYIRALGLRGIRWWWVASHAVRVEPSVRVHHGSKPTMPGYRRRRR